MALPRGYISHSQIRAYNECPRKYCFAYIEGIQPPVNEKVFLGEVFHSAIEHYFLRRIGGAPPSDEAVEDLFRLAFDEAAPGREISWQIAPPGNQGQGAGLPELFPAACRPRHAAADGGEGAVRPSSPAAGCC